jgi:hypothetical protein
MEQNTASAVDDAIVISAGLVPLDSALAKAQGGVTRAPRPHSAQRPAHFLAT